MSGGSFTISNHGVSGSLLAAPIILHQGQAAILGIGKLEKRVIVREVDGQDAILVRPMAYVTLTIDHRVVDGHQTNAWLTPLRRNPGELGRSGMTATVVPDAEQLPIERFERRACDGVANGGEEGDSEHIFVRRVLIVLGLATLFFLVWQLRILLLMLFGAIVIAIDLPRCCRPASASIRGCRTASRRRLSILLVLGSLAALIALVRRARRAAGADAARNAAGRVEGARSADRRHRAERAAGQAGGDHHGRPAAAVCRASAEPCFRSAAASPTCWS